MDLISNTLGRTIRDRRLELGMSQVQVAAITGKTQSQIARLERGLSDARISTVVQVSRSLGTEIMAIPVRLLPAVRHLIKAQEQGGLGGPGKLVGDDPEDLEVEEEDES